MANSEEREAQAKEEQAAGKLTDLYAQVRDLRIETGDSGVGSIVGGLPSFIEQTAIAQGGGTVAVTHEPFELRVRTGADSVAYLDIYDPRGTYQSFTTPSSIVTLDATKDSSTSAFVDLGDGWFQMGTADALSGGSSIVYVYATANTPAFNVSTSTRVEAIDALKALIGMFSIANGAWGASNNITGAFSRFYRGDGDGGIYADNHGTLTADLDSVTWGPDTVCYLCRLYSDIVSWGGKENTYTRSAIPTAEDGKQCFAVKIEARTHAADHVDYFFPLKEA